MIIATASKIGTLWKNADLERKKKIQKLVFPEGIFWDKKKRAFLTKKRNATFDILDGISESYRNKKRTASFRSSPLCGVVNKFLTNFEDFIMVYLSGIQTIGVFKKY